MDSDHGTGRSTAYRSIDEGTDVLIEQARDRHPSRGRDNARRAGTGHLVVDGITPRTDRCAEKSTSVKGAEIDRGDLPPAGVGPRGRPTPMATTCGD
ncbi:hypothetical protein GCM10009799_06000 [Nocardiopsis rhodophaea]|uniref:Transposase n=1 Tax=Nocardiopsis rhodophaea TaxID=280238 RepID=A0ABN2SBS1_9ACTN